MEQILLFKFLIILIILIFMVQTINKRYIVLKEFLSYGLLISAAILTCYLIYLNNYFKDIIEVSLWITLMTCYLFFWMEMGINDTKLVKVSCNAFAIILIILIIFFI